MTLTPTSRFGQDAPARILEGACFASTAGDGDELIAPPRGVQHEQHP